jgi:hypothetical protein
MRALMRRSGRRQSSEERYLHDTRGWAMESFSDKQSSMSRMNLVMNETLHSPDLDREHTPRKRLVYSLLATKALRPALVIPSYVPSPCPASAVSYRPKAISNPDSK